jgi:hypothetical protein
MMLGGSGDINTARGLSKLNTNNPQTLSNSKLNTNNPQTLSNSTLRCHGLANYDRLVVARGPVRLLQRFFSSVTSQILAHTGISTLSLSFNSPFAVSNSGVVLQGEVPKSCQYGVLILKR